MANFIISKYVSKRKINQHFLFSYKEEVNYIKIFFKNKRGDETLQSLSALDYHCLHFGISSVSVCVCVCVLYIFKQAFLSYK